LKKDDRYMTVEQSVINSCREINLIRAGLSEKRNWRTAFSELKKELSKDLSEEKFSPKNISKVGKVSA